MAALRDLRFYEYLALADALRGGRVRERKYAEAELHDQLQEFEAFKPPQPRFHGRHDLEDVIAVVDGKLSSGSWL